MGKLAQQFATDGFAIWLTGEQPTLYFDVHINEWIVPKDNAYIDIGIRLYDSKNINECFFYAPYTFLSDELVDLSPMLTNEEIARGIFNANCKIISSSDSKIDEIQYNGRTENLIHLLNDFITLTAIKGGTLLKISLDKIANLLKHDESYLRFRIPHKTLDAFFKEKKYNYKAQFESPIITQRYNYVIKLNEVRSLPFEIRNIFPKAKQHINKVITTLSVSEEYIVDDSFCYKTRHLEEDLYKNYVPSCFSCSNVIVYQWYENNKSHYNFNIKIDYSTIIKTSFFLYALLFIIFNFIGNILWDLFQQTINFL